jgi:hypothetical protein
MSALTSIFLNARGGLGSDCCADCAVYFACIATDETDATANAFYSLYSAALDRFYRESEDLDDAAQTEVLVGAACQ